MFDDEHATKDRPNHDGVGLREAVPDERLVSRRMRVFGGAEVDHARYPAADGLWVPPLDGHVVVLHLSGGPHRLVHRRDGRSHEATEVSGSVHIVPHGPPHEWVWDGEPENLSVLLEDGLLRRVAAEVGADPDGLEILHHFGGRDPQTERLMLPFLPELETGGLGGELYAQGLAQALAVHLLREHSSLGEKAKRNVGREPRSGLSARALRAATDFIGDNLSGDLSLAEIAAQANLSPHHFSRLFRESTGLPPHQYVIRERVEKAKGLLLAGLSVGEAARLAGFADQSHLGRYFRRLVGVRPKDFRR